MNHEESQDRISGTLKGGPGYEAPWIVLRAGTVNEYNQLVAELSFDSGALEATANVAVAFQTVYLNAKDQPQGNGQAPPQAAPQGAAPSWVGPPRRPASAAQEPPPQGDGGQAHPQGATCKKCSQFLTWRTETSKRTGNQYSAYICPNGPGGGHDLEFGKNR